MKKTVPQAILDLFKLKFGKKPFKLFREGDPIVIPQSMLPALIVSEPETDYDTGPTGHDNITHQILIQIVYNKKDDFGNPTEGSSLDATLDAIAQGRDETTGDFVSTSVMGVLRTNITLENLVISNVGKVRKGVIPRSEDLTTAEVHIEITVEEIQAISNRT
jgi:hypothetical protein